MAGDCHNYTDRINLSSQISFAMAAMVDKWTGQDDVGLICGNVRVISSMRKVSSDWSDAQSNVLTCFISSLKAMADCRPLCRAFGHILYF